MVKPLLAVRVKNIFKKSSYADMFEVELKNISINGVKQGCSGYITNKKNGRIVYINTESLLNPHIGKILLRLAGMSKEEAITGMNTYCTEEELLARIYGHTGGMI